MTCVGFLVATVMFIVRKEIITINLHPAFENDTFSRLGVSIYLEKIGRNKNQSAFFEVQLYTHPHEKVKWRKTIADYESLHFFNNLIHLNFNCDDLIILRSINYCLPSTAPPTSIDTG